MFITEADINVQAGTGGPGKVSFETKAGTDPDGGDGGQGGDVYIVGTNDIFALKRYKLDTEFSAEDGSIGESGKRPGKNGKILLLKFPIGSTVKDKKSGFIYEIKDKKNKIKIAKGGRGGRGNYSFKFYKKFSRTYYEKGLEGTEREFYIELKLVADYGLIGLPNAGKSSLLNELTSAKVKVAGYPFTTLEPNIANIGEKIIADIPGLIEGASDGKGLGTKFLKHIEQINLLVHCVPADSEDIVKEYNIVCKEIKKYSPIVAKKDKIILLTKSDMVTPEVLKEKQELLGQFGYEVISTSIHDWDGLEKMRNKLRHL